MCKRLPDITPKLNGEILARAEQIIKDENLIITKSSDFDTVFNRAIVEFGFDVEYYNMKMTEIGSEDLTMDRFGEDNPDCYVFCGTDDCIISIEVVDEL